MSLFSTQAPSFWGTCRFALPAIPACAEPCRLHRDLYGGSAEMSLEKLKRVRLTQLAEARYAELFEKDPERLLACSAAPRHAAINSLMTLDAHISENGQTVQRPGLSVHWRAPSTVDKNPAIGASMQITFYMKDSERWANIDRIEVKTPGQGIGTCILAELINNLSKEGFRGISLFAARDQTLHVDDKELVGYYTWLRMGFFVDFTSLQNERELDAIYDIGSPKDSHQLFSFKNGPEIWQKDGFGVDAVFDLRPRSDSHRIFRAYRLLKGIVTPHDFSDPQVRNTQ